MTDEEKQPIDSACFKEMCRALANAQDSELICAFLECILTPAERRHISERWLLVSEIDQGTTQREIAKKFGMSLCKITRGSRELKKEGNAFKKMLDLA
jgi:TrpR family trp operon transcriptional repressor